MCPQRAARETRYKLLPIRKPVNIQVEKNASLKTLQARHKPLRQTKSLPGSFLACPSLAMLRFRCATCLQTVSPRREGNFSGTIFVAKVYAFITSFQKIFSSTLQRWTHNVGECALGGQRITVFVSRFAKLKIEIRQSALRTSFPGVSKQQVSHQQVRNPRTDKRH
jgi:hypothetical protein